MASAAEAALGYVRAGFLVVPIPPRQKRPVLDDWPNLRITEAELKQYFNGGGNVGLILGVDGLTDVDLDSAEACTAAAELLPATPFRFGRASKPASHAVYRARPQAPRTKQYKDPVDHVSLAELRGRKSDGTIGLQTVLPGSVHPSGEEVRLEPGASLTPAEIDAAALERAVVRTAAAALLARHWPREGSRNAAFLALAGTLARAGWAEEEAAAFHRALYRCLWERQADLTQAEAEVRATYEKYRDGTEITGLRTLRELMEVRVVAAAMRWLGIGEPTTECHTRAQGGDEWPTPEPLAETLPPVLPFDLELLPEALRPLVADVAERMQVPADYPAAVAVLCLAGVVSRRAVVQPKAKDASWTVVPNLWGGIIGPPGFMKSPVMAAVVRPLIDIQADWRREYEEQLADYESAKEEYELRRAAWREQFKAATKKGRGAPERPDNAPEKPTLRRLIINDATFEALHEIMSENPAGVLVIRDELTGWWSLLDRAGREGERAFCLQAWNGDTGHTIDRIGRGTIHVEHCCMSMVGAIQPGRLRSYLVDTLQDGPSNDGLVQRFQVLVWPDTTAAWRYVDRPADAACQKRAEQVFRSLIELDAEAPPRFQFDAEAQELFVAWLQELETKVRGEELHPALVSHLSKYRKLMPALALLFELAERSGRGSEGFVGPCLVGDMKICLAQARRAAAWCEYLESHARRVYSCVVTPQLRAARELAEKIRTLKVGADGTFSCREVYVKGWSGLDSPEAVRQAVEVLEDAGWVRAVAGGSGPLGGRPSSRFEVNPRVWEKR